MSMNELCATSCDSPSTYSPPPMSIKLAERKERLEAELMKVNTAIDLMEKSPELSSLLNVISQLHL